MSIDVFDGFVYFSAWFDDTMSPAIARLTRMIGTVTNLSMETAELLQVDAFIFFICLVRECVALNLGR